MQRRTNVSKRKAFTLIELLVVISIIALLLSILMPSLQRAKEMGMRAVCLSNLHQLPISWAVYASNNDDRIISAYTRNGSNDPTVALGENGWVRWSPEGSGPLTAEPIQEATRQKSAFGQIVEDQLDCIKEGDLFNYTKSVDMYKCPVGRGGNERTYAIMDSMNGWNPHDWMPGWPDNPLVYKKISKIKDSSRKMVFLDCGEQSYASWTQPVNGVNWMENVQSRHGEGNTFSFSDGHAEHRKWQHQYTKLLGKLSIYQYFYGFRPPEIAGSSWSCITSSNPYTDPNPDFLWIHKGMWGTTYDY